MNIGTWLMTHGEVLVSEALPEHKSVEFRCNRKKYIAYGWWTTDGNINMVVTRNAGKNKGIIDTRIPVPGGSFPRSNTPCNKKPSEDIDISKVA